MRQQGSPPDLGKKSVHEILLMLRPGQARAVVVAAASLAIFMFSAGISVGRWTASVAPQLPAPVEHCDAKPDWPRGEWVMTNRDSVPTDRRTADRIIVNLSSGYRWITTLQKTPRVLTNSSEPIRAGDYKEFWFGSSDPGRYDRRENLHVSPDGCRMSGDYSEQILPPGWKDGDPQTNRQGTVAYEWTGASTGEGR